MKRFMRMCAVMLSLVVSLVTSGVQSELLEAIEWGSVDAVKALLEKEADINGKIKGICALETVFSRSSFAGRNVLAGPNARRDDEVAEIAKLLIAKGADVNGKDSKGNPLFISAIKLKDVELIKLFVAKGADVNGKDSKGNPFFISAIQLKDMELIKLFVAKGADVNAKDAEGYPAYLYMAITDNVPGMELLISKGADISLGLAGYIAAVSGSTAIVDFLLKHGLSVNSDMSEVFIYGGTLAHAAAKGKNNGKSVLKLLLSKGADINAKDKEGRTPLHLAASDGTVDVVQLLLSKGADANAKDKSGMTPLQLAKAKNNAEAVMVLGGDVDEKFTDKDGRTLLHHAVRLGMTNCVAKVLEKGIPVNAKDKNGYTALHIAAGKNDVNAAKLLLEKGARQLKDNDGANPLHFAAVLNSTAVAKLLLEKGAKPNVKDKADFTPLEYAVRENHLDVAKVLVDHGADVNAKLGVRQKEFDATKEDTDIISVSIIEYAMLKKHIDMAKLLISAKGAKLNFTREEMMGLDGILGEDELHNGFLIAAAKSGSSDVVALLVSKLNLENFIYDCGEALCIAAKNGNADMCRVLLDRLDAEGKTNEKINIGILATVHVAMGRFIEIPVFPLHEAVSGGNPDCVKLLIDRGADVNRRRSFLNGLGGGDGNTPLHCAVQNKDAKTAVALVKLLMDKGAKAGITNSKGQKAVDLTKNDEIIEMLDGAE